MKVKKIRPFLWFDDNAEEAMNFYLSIFKNSKGLSDTPAAGEKPMSVRFELEGQEFMAFNAGPHFKFTPAISFFVDCKDQAEVDELWEKLSAGGEKGQCGWLTDKFGLSWQIVPTILGDLLNDPDPVKAKNAMDAMMKMTKLDIAKLKEAAGKK